MSREELESRLAKAREDLAYAEGNPDTVSVSDRDHVRITDGLREKIEILEDELVSTMGLAGLTSISQVNPKYVCKAEAVTPPHEMSAWVNIPGYRIG